MKDSFFEWENASLSQCLSCANKGSNPKALTMGDALPLLFLCSGSFFILVAQSWFQLDSKNVFSLLIISARDKVQ